MTSLDLPVSITEEKDSKGKPIFVVHSPLIDVVSQGKTKKEAVSNLKEAIELYFEDKDAKKTVSRYSISCIKIKLSKEAYNNLPTSLIDHAKAACPIREETA